MTTLSCKLEISEEAAAREVGGEIVILDFKSGEYFGLDGVGTRVWQIIEREASCAGEICDQLIKEFTVSRSQLQDDILRLVNELLERGLLVSCDLN